MSSSRSDKERTPITEASDSNEDKTALSEKSETSIEASSSSRGSNSSNQSTPRLPRITKEFEEDDIEDICNEFKLSLMEDTIKKSTVYRDEITGLFMASKLSGFSQFGYTGKERNPEDTAATRGWKLHISIMDKEKNNLIRGWEALLPIFVKYKLIGKIVNSDEQFYKKREHGKQVTIYYFNTPDRPWQNIINDIENVLTESKVIPDKLPEFPIIYPIFRDSCYISYINDGPNSKTYKPTAVIVDADGHRDDGPFVQYEPVHLYYETKDDHPEVMYNAIKNDLNQSSESKDSSDINANDDPSVVRFRH